MGMQYSRGLVAGYPFENTANDIMGVNNGTVYGATYVDGQIGRALSFDGVDDAVGCGNVFNPQLSDFSFSIRIKPTGTQGSLAGLIGKSDGTGTFPRWALSIIGISLYVVWNDRFLIIPTSNIPNDQWTHICCTFKRTDSMRIYINSVLKDTEDISSFQNYNMTNAYGFFIGSLTSNTNVALPQYFFKGCINDVKIYNKALTQAEIQRDYLNLPIF